jgi:hypothetical protein
MVAGMPRSGTTAVHNTLRGHPSVSALHKEVAVDPFLTQGVAIFTRKHPKTRPSISSLFDLMTSPQSVAEPEARGMKLTTGSEDRAQAFVEAVRTHLPDVRIILLVRGDLVAQFGSHVKSRKTGVWGRHVGESKGRRTAPTLELDRYEFAEYAIEAHQIRRTLRGLKNTHDVLEINYEDVLLEGNLPTYDPLFKFVGIKSKQADWLTDRKLSPPPESYIENYDELTTIYGRIKRELKEGTSPENLYRNYGRSLPGRLWKRATFWGRRPGYAMFRVEQRVRDAFGLRSANENSKQ